ncbi:RelE toxin of RelEB toxin-antitoxin system [Pectobacterium versatile]|nr:RelE toxin of RelEB toxin-antitoxin system [Pectobacterium versatile]
MRVFKTKWFTKAAKSHAIKDSELYEAIEAVMVIKSKERVEICHDRKK